MARKQCQVCGQPATVRVEANLNGRHSTMLLCDDHYRQLARQQSQHVASLLHLAMFEGIQRLVGHRLNGFRVGEQVVHDGAHINGGQGERGFARNDQLQLSRHFGQRCQCACSVLAVKCGQR